MPKGVVVFVVIFSILGVIALGFAIVGTPARVWAENECFKMGYQHVTEVDGVWYCYNKHYSGGFWGSDDMVGVPVRLGRYEDK